MLTPDDHPVAPKQEVIYYERQYYLLDDLGTFPPFAPRERPVATTQSTPPSSESTPSMAFSQAFVAPYIGASRATAAHRRELPAANASTLQTGRPEETPTVLHISPEASSMLAQMEVPPFDPMSWLFKLPEVGQYPATATTAAFSLSSPTASRLGAVGGGDPGKIHPRIDPYGSMAAHSQEQPTSRAQDGSLFGSLSPLEPHIVSTMAWGSSPTHNTGQPLATYQLPAIMPLLQTQTPPPVDGKLDSQDLDRIV